jgi:hypothetical protein
VRVNRLDDLDRHLVDLRRGVAGLVVHPEHRLFGPGCEVLNEAVLNQVPFRFGTDQILGRVNDSGEAWLSGTTAGGRRAIRLSVPNWQTSRADIARAVAGFRDASRQVTVPG